MQIFRWIPTAQLLQLECIEQFYAAALFRSVGCRSMLLLVVNRVGGRQSRHEYICNWQHKSFFPAAKHDRTTYQPIDRRGVSGWNKEHTNAFHGSLKLNLPTNKILRWNMEKLHSHFSTSFAVAAFIKLLCSIVLCSSFEGKKEEKGNMKYKLISEPIIRKHLVKHSLDFPLRNGTILWISGIDEW